MISKTDSALVLEAALGGGADFAELFLEDKEELNIRYSGRVTNLSQIRIFGCGLSLLAGTRRVYVYTNDTSLPALMALCKKACALLAQPKACASPLSLADVSAAEPNPIEIYPGTVSHDEKVKVLQQVDKRARGMGSDVKNINLDFFDTDQRVCIVNTEGVVANDRRVTSRVRLVPTVVSDTGAIGYFTDYTRPLGFEAFKACDYTQFAADTIEDMRQSLRAPDAPSGYVPVVLAAGGCSGTFFHEACGHQLETNDRLLKDGIFLGKIGEKIASDKVTLVDDGTLPSAYGSSRFDDEGMARQRNVLIENGVLKSYLADRLGARKLNVPRNACGRRQGYTYPAAARMSNTYLAPGNDDPQEMISSMAEGLYVVRVGGGSGGKEFTLLAQKAFWVKNGRIDRPVKGAMLLGRGDRTMLDIDRVGSAVEFEEHGAFCGGASGLCNTTTSGAAMRVSGMVVGGKGGKI